MKIIDIDTRGAELDPTTMDVLYLAHLTTGAVQAAREGKITYRQALQVDRTVERLQENAIYKAHGTTMP